MQLTDPEHPNREQSFPAISQTQMLMYLGLGSLSILFAASLVAYFITRAQATSWRPVELPALPAGLWGSTAILLALSGCLRLSQKQLAKSRYGQVSNWLLAALSLSAFFLVLQIANWRQVGVASEGIEGKTLYLYTFFMLTALHALHVVAGVVPLAIVYHRSLSQYYSSSRSEGLRLVTQYWDFLLVVWLVLLVSLWFF